MAIALTAPRSQQALQGISGLGVRKLEAYGDAVLAVMGVPVPASAYPDARADARFDQF